MLVLLSPPLGFLSSSISSSRLCVAVSVCIYVVDKAGGEHGHEGREGMMIKNRAMMTQCAKADRRPLFPCWGGCLSPPPCVFVWQAHSVREQSEKALLMQHSDILYTAVGAMIGHLRIS